MRNSPPRVLLLVTQSELGGAQRYVLLLATHLKRQGYDLVVGCGEGGELIDALNAASIETYILPSMVRDIRPTTDLRALSDLVKFIRDHKFDVVHCNSTKAGMIGRLAARLARAPIVLYTVHGCVLNEPMSRPLFLIYWAIERVMATMTSRIIAVSEYDRETLLRYRIAPASRIATIPNGIPPGLPPENQRDVYRHRMREQLGIPEEALVVGTIANFYRTKALDVLLHAMARAADEHQNLQLVLVGDGQERPSIERLIRELGLEDRVVLTGQLPEGRRLLPAFDIFVLASRKEGLPLALLEAMAAGLPVIVTQVGGMPEVVDHGHAGLTVPPEDPEELAAAMLDLISSPELAATLGRDARQRVLSHFTDEHMLARTLELYPGHDQTSVPGTERGDLAPLSGIQRVVAPASIADSRAHDPGGDELVLAP